ncbi:TonB-dependent siderophore receptor [Phyllobacterium sp. K27]
MTVEQTSGLGTMKAHFCKLPYLLLGSTLLFSVPLFSVASAQQVSDTGSESIKLDTIVIDSGNSVDGEKGIVAKRNRTGSKTDTPLIETPQAVSVVTRDQMDAQGANSVAEALRYTPGVFADPNGYDVRYDWLYIRGFNTYGTMWLDGLAIPGDPANYATPTINSYALERVEVIKGPASVLYGRAVPGGLVNMVSKRPQGTPYREASVQTNGFGGVQGSVDMTGPITEDGEWLYRFTGLAKNLHTQIDSERDEQIMLAPSLTWSPSTDTSLTLYGYYQRDRPTFSPRFYPAVGTLLPNKFGQIPRDVFLGDQSSGEFNRDYYMGGYEFSHSFDETWTVRQNLRYGRSDQDMFLALVNPAFAYGGEGHTLNRVSAISDEYLTTFAVDTQAEAKFETGEFEHTVLFGLDYLRAQSSTQFGNSPRNMPVPPIDYLDPIYQGPIPVPDFQRSALQKQSQVGFYVQDQIKYDRWVGTFGLRYDISKIDSLNRMSNAALVETDDKKLTGRAGIAYLFDNGLAPYASYSTSFLPVLGTDRLNAPFEAQTAEQFEVGVKYAPDGGRGMITLSLFQMTMDNYLTPDALDIQRSVQSGRQRVRGLEVEGKYEISSELTVLAAYAYSDSEVIRSNNAKELGKEMLRLPEHQGSLWAIYAPSYVPGLAVSAGVRAISSYQTDSTYLSDLRIPSRALVDIGAEYDFGALNKEFEGTKLRINVSNLFDKKYVSHCLNITGGSCNYGAGRTITANLKYAW